MSEDQLELGKKRPGDMMTLRIRIDDKEKASWIWDLIRSGILKMGTPPDLGISIRMSAWGDLVGEQGFVMDRIEQYLSRWDQDDLREEYGVSDRSASLEELEDLIEIWKKEARTRFGSDTEEAASFALQKADKAKARILEETREREARASAEKNPPRDESGRGPSDQSGECV